ncbi:MAG: toll/interleukin-1 receptor domain-containing protein [Rubrivivax sp.]|nr:toll/interleukin-1 receptor domain-containing protein [Rubrivivax sp.]
MVHPTSQFWDDLLLFIEDGRVIPVIGPELVTVADGDTSLPLVQWLARGLARVLELPAADLPAAFDLNDVVALHVRRGGERDMLYARLLQLLRKAPAAPAPALAALAGIAPLKLFVSMCFDSQLEAALSRQRPGTPAQVVAYAPNALRDLPVPHDELRQPLVYHLLGRASSTPDFAICDDDLLEFLHALQDGPRRPARLFDALRANHLLILGCGFGDWLARFFLRTARGLELSQKRKRWDVLADTRSGQDAALTVFLASYSAETRMLPMAPTDFVAELAQRWHALHAAAQPASSPASAPGDAGRGDGARGERGPRDGAVFISYASEDRAAAQRLAEGLRGARLDVWFDQRELQVADDWSAAIERGIARCALFVPVISRAALAEANRRRYFWREWNAAEDRSRGMAPDEEYIVPVVIDGSRLGELPLPPGFLRKQGCALPGGEPTSEVAQRFTTIVQNFHRRRRALS